MYFPSDHLRVRLADVVVSAVLTFFVLLRLIRRLEVVPSNPIVTPKTMNIRHRVYPSSEHPLGSAYKHSDAPRCQEARPHAQ